MRLTALLLLVFNAVLLNTNAQSSSSGTFSIDGTCFKKASYSFNYSFVKERIEEDGLKFSLLANLNISFKYPNDAVYTSYSPGGKSYTPSDLGLSEWPQKEDNRMGLSLELAFYHNNTLLFRRDYQSAKIPVGGQFIGKTYSPSEQKTVKQEPLFAPVYDGPKIKNFSVENCRIEVEGIRFIICPSFASELERKISEKNKSGASSSNTSSSSSSSTPTSSYSSSSSTTTSTSSSIYSEETAVLVGKTVEVGAAFFDGLAANRDRRLERESNERIELAEIEIRNKKIQNCHTPECNAQKGDIYNKARDGVKYSYSIWKVAAEYYSKAGEAGNTYAIKKILDYYISESDKKAYWTGKLISIYLKKANEGDVGSMWYLARIYDNYYGQYSKKFNDNNKALYWYEKAADGDDEDAQEKLIEVYKYGKMRQKKDYAEALKYAEDLFNNDYGSLDQKKIAKNEIVDIYKDGGYGIEKNIQLAKEWEAKVADFYEEFSYDVNGWPEVTDTKFSTNIKDGKYLVEVSNGNKASTIDIPCYQEKDFEISSRIRKVEGDDKTLFGLLLGADKKLEKYFALHITNTGEYSLGVVTSKNTSLIKVMGATTKLIMNENSYNELTLRKVGDKFKMYMNNVFIAEAPSQYFFGQKFGFFIWSEDKKVVIEADNFVIRELESGESEPIPETSNTGSPPNTVSSQSILAFNDNFDNNSNDWYQQTTDKSSFAVQDGKYRIESNGGNWFASKPVILDQTRNYEISATVTKVDGTDGYYYGIVLGKDVQSGFYHFIGITGWGNYVLFANKGTTISDIIPTKTNEVVKKGNATNNITLRKSENVFEFFVNDQLVGETPAESFFGNLFGFEVWSGNEKIKVDFDDLIIRYLN